jgi:hypothetical protein
MHLEGSSSRLDAMRERMSALTFDWPRAAILLSANSGRWMCMTSDLMIAIRGGPRPLRDSPEQSFRGMSEDCRREPVQPPETAFSIRREGW